MWAFAIPDGIANTLPLATLRRTKCRTFSMSTRCVCVLRPHGFVLLPSSCPTIRWIYVSGHGRSTHVPVCSMARTLQGVYARDRLLPSPDGGLARLLLYATVHASDGNVTHHHNIFGEA